MRQRCYADSDGPSMIADDLRSARPTRLRTIRKMPTFPGPGCYALYYSGAEPLYRAIAVNGRPSKSARPIYIGQADRLHSRLLDHIASLTDATNMRVGDFWFRCLAMHNSVHSPAVERLLIRDFRPVWNMALRGFGNHDPGGTCRRGQNKSPWDTVHPGRRSAGFRQSKQTAAALRDEVRKFLSD